MRPIYIYLITSIGIAASWMNCTQQAHGQLSQVLKDYKHDRPFQYAPSDPWTRSKLFNKQTKHSGFGYNCDGEECKRNSPYICWKTHAENDLPKRTQWWKRLNQTASEIKLRVADGSCIKCAEADLCQRCQQNKCGGCCDCQSSSGVATATNAMDHSIPEKLLSLKPPRAVIDVVSTETLKPTHTRTSLIPQPKVTRQDFGPVRSAGLESLDTRVK